MLMGTSVCCYLCSLEADAESEFSMQDFYEGSIPLKGRERTRLGKGRNQTVMQA